MTHADKIEWMHRWAAKNGLSLELEGECGFGRECVGVTTEGHYPDYQWHNEDTWEREDANGEVWAPEHAYHKHDCVAVLGRGQPAEEELYQWLKWFEDNGFVCETGDKPLSADMQRIGPLAFMLGKHRYARMVRKPEAKAA